MKAIGRPSKLNQDLIEKAFEYVTGGFANDPTNELFPTVHGMALICEVYSGTMDIWAAKGSTIQEPADDIEQVYADFSMIYNVLKDRQAMIVIRGVTIGTFNASLGSMLLARAHAGYGKDTTININNTTNTIERMDISKFTPEMHAVIQDAINSARRPPIKH